MDKLLRTMDEYGTKGTFFWLGELAEEYPDLVRTVVDAGHRIGCHGWFHNFVSESPPAILEQQVSDARNRLEDITGKQVLSFRAPFFSITRDTLWILDMLVGLGFTIDSSIFPTINWRYGIPGFPDEIRKVRRKSGSLWLAPVTTRRILGVSVPVSGGAYFRLYPYAFSRANFLWAARQGKPAVFYIHPWELDPDHPRRSFDSRARLTHYAKLSSCEGKLRMLLSEFRFEPLEDTVGRLRKVPPVSLPVRSGRDKRSFSRRGTSLLWDHGLKQRTSAHCSTLVDLSIQKRVLLDIGTRDGKVLSEVSHTLGIDLCIGIDLERDCFPQPSPDAMILIQGDGQAIPLQNGSVDLILCTSTFKHIWDVDSMLTECARVLAPGGLLSLVDVTPSGIRFGIASGHLERGAVHRILDLDELFALLTSHGFEVEFGQRFMALPFRVPGTRTLEALLRRRGFDGFMFYQIACGRIHEGPATGSLEMQSLKE